MLHAEPAIGPNAIYWNSWLDIVTDTSSTQEELPVLVACIHTSDFPELARSRLERWVRALLVLSASQC